jgi:hypothetical protein
MRWPGILVAFIGLVCVVYGVLAWRGSYNAWRQIVPGRSLTWAILFGGAGMILGLATLFIHTPLEVAIFPMCLLAMAAVLLGFFIVFVDPRWAMPPREKRRDRGK